LLGEESVVQLAADGGLEAVSESDGQPLKRFYVWFDAVIGYLSASVEWAQRTGDRDARKKWWTDPDATGYYFMGKNNIVFHSLIWPSLLLGRTGRVIGAVSRARSAP
jgi:methionyl-tRNA synthetase